LTTPPPPRSSLSPYTTLFRSNATLAPSAMGLAAPCFDTFECVSTLSPNWLCVALIGAHWQAGLVLSAPGNSRLLLRVGKPSPFVDRKSTRLNSSHVAISYAVF